jgi:Tfp pilus assembly protein PilW
MKRAPKLNKTQAGLSIIELMVALVLGLLLMTGVLQVFLASKQTFATNEAISRLQENGRFGLDFIARSARMAGYFDATFDPKSPPLGIVLPDCEGLPGSPPDEVCTTEGGTNTSDSVGFVMQPQLQNNLRLDCRGVAVTDPNVLIINHFEIIEKSTTEPRSLGCRSYHFDQAGNNVTTGGPGAQRLVDGVDSMQILYGIDTSSEGYDENANSYVSADRIKKEDWLRVRSVRIAILANSINTVLPPPADRNFVLLDATPLGSANLGDDKLARQIFTTTVQLKNI